MTTPDKRKMRERRPLHKRGTVAGPVPIVGYRRASYLRLGGLSGIPIRYHRIGARQPTSALDTRTREGIFQLACIVCKLPADSIDEIFGLPSRTLGRLIKTMLRCSFKANPARGAARRRPRRRSVVRDVNSRGTNAPGADDD